MESMMLILVMIAVFYLMIIRPENKRKKQAEEMRNSIKKGERITTIGGMIGRVVQVNDSTVVFETSEDRVRIEIAKWGIQSTESMEQAAAAQRAKKPAKKAEEPAKAEAAEETAEKVEEAVEKVEETAKDYDPEIK